MTPTFGDLARARAASPITGHIPGVARFALRKEADLEPKRQAPPRLTLVARSLLPNRVAFRATRPVQENHQPTF